MHPDDARIHRRKPDPLERRHWGLGAITRPARSKGNGSPPAMKDGLLFHQPRPIWTFPPSFDRSQQLDDLAGAFLGHGGEFLGFEDFHRLPTGMVLVLVATAGPVRQIVELAGFGKIFP